MEKVKQQKLKGGERDELAKHKRFLGQGNYPV